jgi:hypothetical protein
MQMATASVRAIDIVGRTTDADVIRCATPCEDFVILSKNYVTYMMS